MFLLNQEKGKNGNHMGELEEKWIFQVWRVGEVIANNATTKTNLESLASLVNPENVPADTNYQNLCTQVTNIWSNLFSIL